MRVYYIIDMETNGVYYAIHCTSILYNMETNGIYHTIQLLLISYINTIYVLANTNRYGISAQRDIKTIDIINKEMYMILFNDE